MEIYQQAIRTQGLIERIQPTDAHGIQQAVSLQGCSLLSLKAHRDQVVLHDWRRANVVSIFEKVKR